MSKRPVCLIPILATLFFAALLVPVIIHWEGVAGLRAKSLFEKSLPRGPEYVKTAATTDNSDLDEKMGIGMGLQIRTTKGHWMLRCSGGRPQETFRKNMPGISERVRGEHLVEKVMRSRDGERFILDLGSQEIFCQALAGRLRSEDKKKSVR